MSIPNTIFGGHILKFTITTFSPLSYTPNSLVLGRKEENVTFSMSGKIYTASDDTLNLILPLTPPVPPATLPIPDPRQHVINKPGEKPILAATLDVRGR